MSWSTSVSTSDSEEWIEWFGPPTTVDKDGDDYLVKIYHKRSSCEFYATVNESSTTESLFDPKEVLVLLRQCFEEKQYSSCNGHVFPAKVWIHKGRNAFASFYTIGCIPDVHVPIKYD